MVETFESENQYGRGVVKSWASLLDDNCLAQAQLISRSPVVTGHLALMPDAHFGFGPPVGSVLNTTGGVMPYAVGVDIGCGMIAARTSLERGALAGKERHTLGHIRDLIPAGQGGDHKGAPLPQADAWFDANGLPPSFGTPQSPRDRKGQLIEEYPRVQSSMRDQFGSLGSGNHFVEVCEDVDGAVWLLLHSGSRGIGNRLASSHFERAKGFCKAEGIEVEHPEGSYLPAGTDEYEAYLGDMLWAQRYAFAQREAMLDQLIVAVEREAGSFDELERVNCHHNYAELLDDGTTLRTRKGAIDASTGKAGIIPGSMGAATYIVRGLGNEEAHLSSPHGAGRVLGRNVARKSLDLETFAAQMAGRTWQDRDAKKLLDEAPDAYKPIDQVMADSKELVEPAAMLSQFINYKGV